MWDNADSLASYFLLPESKSIAASPAFLTKSFKLPANSGSNNPLALRPNTILAALEPKKLKSLMPAKFIICFNFLRISGVPMFSMSSLRRALPSGLLNTFVNLLRAPLRISCSKVLIANPSSWNLILFWTPNALEVETSASTPIALANLSKIVSLTNESDSDSRSTPWIIAWSWAYANSVAVWRTANGSPRLIPVAALTPLDNPEAPPVTAPLKILTNNLAGPKTISPRPIIVRPDNNPSTAAVATVRLPPYKARTKSLPILAKRFGILPASVALTLLALPANVSYLCLKILRWSLNS